MNAATGGTTPQELAEKALARSRAIQARGKRLRWLALGALLLAAVVGGISTAHKLTAKALARRDIWRLEHAIQAVQNAEGSYPANEQELVRALGRLNDPAVLLDDQGRPLDHWGRPFRYRYPGVQIPGMFDLWTVGANGEDEDGGPDDQTNWR